MFQYDPYGGGGGGGPRQRRVFENQYQCFSMAIIDKSHLDDGDKIILPTSALNTLSRMEIEYPMLFEIKNEQLNRKTHCGVIEFIAEEGRCHLPCHMMQNLLVEEGSIISIKNVSLPKCSFLKVRAQSVDFLDISNPRAVLEYTLRKYTCVTVGDVIVLQHLGKLFQMDVQEVRPNGAASIVETDVEIDFDEPLGYKESEYGRHEREHEAKKSAAAAGSSSSSSASSTSGGVFSQPPSSLQKARIDANDADAGPKFQAFSGAGKRIDGKSSSASSSVTNTPYVSGKDNVKGSSSSSSSSSSVLSSSISASSITAVKTSVKANTLSSSSSSSSSNGIADTTTSASAPVVPTYQSKIGDKYSKKKTAVSAFTGTGNKLV